MPSSALRLPELRSSFGETKSLSLDLGNGEERTYPVTPAVSGQSGTATFAIEFPQT